jgi:uncharacterized membrane protein YedE/YeeE
VTDPNKPAGMVRTMLTEDDANKVWDPVRIGFLGGMVIYLGGGCVLIAALMHTVWGNHAAVDFQAYGIALAAWASGFGVYLTGTGAALWMKAKGDNV